VRLVSMSEATSVEAAAPDLFELETAVVETVRRWLEVAAQTPPDRAATQLAGMLQDEDGLAFTLGFVDGVIRPEDPRVAARTFAGLARNVPRFLPLHVRLAVRIGAAVGVVAPALVIPVVRRVLRRMVGHLVIDARHKPLTKAIRKLRSAGAELNLNLLGEAVLGDREAARRIEGTQTLLARDDVDYVSMKVSSTVAPQSAWALDEAVDRIVGSLTPLFWIAANATPHKFINLDMEEYRDLELTVAVFTRLLDNPQFHDLHAGIVLQAYLPDTMATMIQLQEWAARRVAEGGAPVKVRVVKGANLPMERVEAAVHDWPLATWQTKQDSDTNYKRLLDYALHPDRTANVRIGVASHNLFDVAFAWLLAQQRDVLNGVDFEMLLGMAAGQAEAVRRDVGNLLLYTPVVHPKEFDVAIAYLVRRLEEAASHDNFMSAVFDLHDSIELFDRERQRFTASLAAADRNVPVPRRNQNRATDAPETLTTGFRNAADTDPAIRANQHWGRDILARVPSSTLGNPGVAVASVTTSASLERHLADTVAASTAWGDRCGRDRAAVLRSAAVELERRRADLIEVMASECGKTIDQADPEVSEAIDFANYYAVLAEALDDIDGAVHEPVGLTVVTPPWNFPVAIATGSTVAPLAAGSAVIIKPAPQAKRCAAVVVDALHAAGVPTDVLRLVDMAEGDLAQSLISDPRVDRLILTGAFETAQLFRTFRQDLPLLAETSGKNAIIVTPSADLDLAVKDVTASAFGHAGQKCSAASLLILVGSVARSDRFRNQLTDAVQSLEVGPPDKASTRMGPLIEPASGKLLDALTILQPGEQWLVQPRRIDDSGQVWTPGVKAGVAPGSPFHHTEYFGPVLGIMTAKTLDEAIDLQNAVAYGLAAGLQSLDPSELSTWLDRVHAGNLYINRGVTGAIVRRQPFGGWKRSAVGAGSKAGGPNYLVGLSNWTSAPSNSDATLDLRQTRILHAVRTAKLPDVEFLERALASDADAWSKEFGTARDVSQIGVERNILRYRARTVLVRHETGTLTNAIRVASAGVLAGADVSLSTDAELPANVADALTANGVRVAREGSEQFRQHLSTVDSACVRLVGGEASAVYAAVDGRPEVAVYAQPVTEAGRIEMLPFLREQAISITAHRFGTPDHLSDAVLVENRRVCPDFS
jgi:RHH-type transcriptional regulator, proline utilization regulon repressor / proline dehydrogenase / delta 1-pyrroline-5-carboxylate dehydrogenase